MVRKCPFTATPSIQMSGNNQGYIYSPSTLQYLGPAFDLAAGEELTIVPYQPADQGPWKIYRSLLVDSDLKTMTKKPKVFILIIRNRWLTRSIRVNRYTTLDTILCNQGIEHCYSTLSFDDLLDINISDDEDVDNNDDDDDTTKKSTAHCVCPCCTK
jgi:hypothetical protein